MSVQSACVSEVQIHSHGPALRKLNSGLRSHFGSWQLLLFLEKAFSERDAFIEDDIPGQMTPHDISRQMTAHHSLFNKAVVLNEQSTGLLCLLKAAHGLDNLINTWNWHEGTNPPSVRWSYAACV